MIEFDITPEILERAERQASTYGPINESIKNGKGIIYGCIGEELFKLFVPEAEFVGCGNYDFDYKGKKFDVKTKIRTVVPKMHYDCSVNMRTPRQLTDYYVFASVLKDKSKGWLLGYCNKPYFMKHSWLVGPGEKDPSNGFYAHVLMRNIFVNQLAPMEKLNG
jgi:hypothetical protein